MPDNDGRSGQAGPSRDLARPGRRPLGRVGDRISHRERRDHGARLRRSGSRPWPGRRLGRLGVRSPGRGRCRRFVRLPGRRLGRQRGRCDVGRVRNPGLVCDRERLRPGLDDLDLRRRRHRRQRHREVEGVGELERFVGGLARLARHRPRRAGTGGRGGSRDTVPDRRLGLRRHVAGGQGVTRRRGRERSPGVRHRLAGETYSRPLRTAGGNGSDGRLRRGGREGGHSREAGAQATSPQRLRNRSRRRSPSRAQASARRRPRSRSGRPRRSRRG